MHKKPSAQIVEEVRDFIDNPYTFPGGYRKLLVMYDGEFLCHACTKENDKLIYWSTLNHDRSGWDAAGVEVYWEGPAELCAHCGEELAAEYGNPYEE